MTPAYAARYRRLHAEHWWWRARQRAVLATIRRHHAADPAHDRVLDVGCGDGLLFDGLAAFGTVCGVEPDPATLDPAGPHRAAIHVGRLGDASAPPGPFALVTALDVLEHVDDDAGLAAQIFARLEPGGTFVATVPAFRTLWTAHDDLNRHVRRYTRASLRRTLAAVGFAVERPRYLFHWVAAAKLGVRAREAAFGAKPETPTVPPRLVNAALDRASGWELRGGRGLGLPFGSSVIAVARKPDVTAARE